MKAAGERGGEGGSNKKKKSHSLVCALHKETLC